MEKGTLSHLKDQSFAYVFNRLFPKFSIIKLSSFLNFTQDLLVLSWLTYSENQLDCLFSKYTRHGHFTAEQFDSLSCRQRFA